MNLTRKILTFEGGPFDGLRVRAFEAHPTVMISECADGEHYALLPIESGFDHIEFPKYELVSIDGCDVVYEYTP